MANRRGRLLELLHQGRLCVSLLVCLRAGRRERTMRLSKRGSAQRNASRHLRPVQLGPPECPIDNRPARYRTRACDPEGWQVIAEFSDAAISGASIVSRRSLKNQMTGAEARRFDVVLTESLDHLSRDLADGAVLHKELAYRGVRIVTLADGDVNKSSLPSRGCWAACSLTI